MQQYFYRTPFAASGDISPVPIGPLGDGSLSYAEGFSFDYERNPATDPAAKRIPRDQTNQLYRDMTDNIGQYQRFGNPEWITSADNGGAAFSYSRSAYVRYDAGAGVRLFASLVDANTSVPGSDPTKWREVEPFSLSLIAVAADYATPSSSTLLTSPAPLATAIRESRFTFAAAARVGPAYTLALPGAAFAQIAGAVVEFSVPDASPAGPLTLKVNALATLPLVTSVEADLAAGDLVAGRAYRAVSNGTKWLITTPLPSQLSPSFVLPNRLAATAGATPNVADLNLALESGWYRAAAAVTNGPAALAGGAIFLEVQATDANNVKQSARAVTGVSEATTRAYERSRIAGTWGPWFRTYSSAPEIQQVAVPPGVVGHCAGVNPPNGWLVRDGSAIGRGPYAELFAVIGTMYGAGDGVTSFNLPNAYTGGGVFDRGGNPDGVYYPDTVGPHGAHVGTLGGGGTLEDAQASPNYSTTAGNVGTETAPKHHLYLPIIKY